MNDLDRLTDALTTYSARAVHAETRAALLETEVTALRAQLAERPMGGSGSGAVVLAEVPADWRIVKRQGRTEIVRPIADGHDGTVVVMTKRLTLPAVWAVFEAALLDRTETEG